jgi:glycosyltransferase involved in cell wall biosynthesis
VSKPLVSVVIAAWNAAEYLSQTLATALSQTWPNLEVILVDDGSTDNTAQAIDPFLSRIRYERRGHHGLAVARNEGIRLANGDYIALLDADDLWHPEKIAIQVSIAERHPQSGLIACDGEEFCDGRVLRDSLLGSQVAAAVRASATGAVTGDFQRESIAGVLIACPAQVLLPRRVVDRIGPFIDSTVQDYDYYLRVARHYPMTFHRDLLVRWRFRPESMSGPRANRQLRWGLDLLPVLRTHRKRCRSADRDLLEQRIRKLVRSVGYQLMIRGRQTGRLPTGSGLLKLWLENPWPPTPLVHLAGLWSPHFVYRLGARASGQRWTPN